MIRHLDTNINHLNHTIMTTLNLNQPLENKKRVLFVNFENSKRLQWNRFRRYGF